MGQLDNMQRRPQPRRLCSGLHSCHVLIDFLWIKFIVFLAISAGSGLNSGHPHLAASASSSSSTQCPLLIPSANSIISYSHANLSENSMATYSCLLGYERFGDANRICVRGRWTGQAPICAINIAIRQLAQQSSNSTEFTVLQGTRQAYESAAYLGVDGTRIYCSRTAVESQPVWRLTFARTYSVVAIRIFGDSVRDIINDMEVSLLPSDSSVNNTDLQTIRQAEREKNICNLSASAVPGDAVAGDKENVTLYLCNADVSARQVLIKRSSYASLRLCEVEVLSQQGVPCQHPGSPVNGIVKLSHVDWPFPPGAVAVYDCNVGYLRIPTETAYHRTCLINGSWDVPEPVCVTNVAQYRTASQSSNFSSYNYPPWQAVDGDLNSCAWTRKEREPWLQLDLLKSYTIHAVSVVLDKERLFYQFHRSLLINISNRSTTGEPLTTDSVVPVSFRRSLVKDAAPGTGIFYLEVPVVGQFVTLFAAGNTDQKFLGICDMQVLASDEIPAVPEHCGLQTPSSAFLYTFKKTCYQVQRFSATNWYNAMLSCQDNGGSLLFNPDYDTTVFLTTVLSNLYRFHPSDDRYWIGAKMSQTDSSWFFLHRNVSSPVGQSFWAPGRPVNDRSSDSCIAMGGHGVGNWSWADYRCDQDPANWICSYGPRNCGDPIQPEASALLVADKAIGISGWKLGDHVQYECAPGYLLTGTTESVCQPDGLWSGTTPNCQFVACGEPPKRSHLYYTLLNGTTFYGSFVQYYCLDESSKLNGKSVLACLGNGAWETLDNVICESAFLRSDPAENADDGVITGIPGSTETLPAADMRYNETIGVGVGVALSLVAVVMILFFCGVRYQRRKAALLAAIPAKKRPSPYSTIRRLHASQISRPIAVMQVQDQEIEEPQQEVEAPQPTAFQSLTPQVSVSDDTYSGSKRSDPDGSLSLSPSDPNGNYLKSFGKAGIIKLYQKAKSGGTLRLPIDERRERPRIPKLVISSPIECRKTVVLDSGTQYARTGIEVIYAQPGKLNGAKPGENQYEYLETARVRGGFGNSEEPVHRLDDGIYSDTNLSSSSKEYLTRPSLSDEVYDDVRNGHLSSNDSQFGRC